MPRDLEAIGKDFSVTRERIRHIEAKAIRKLVYTSRTEEFIIDIKQMKNSGFLTDDEKKQLTELEDDIIINSNTDTCSKYIESFQSIYQTFKDRRTLDRELIEKMDFSVRTYNCLKKQELIQ